MLVISSDFPTSLPLESDLSDQNFGRCPKSRASSLLGSRLFDFFDIMVKSYKSVK